MRVEVPISVHGCMDVVHKCGTTYVITSYNNPLRVLNATEVVDPQHKHVRLYRVAGDSATINGTHVKARQYQVDTCKLAFATMVKDSAKFLPAWCTYHRRIGADFFFIYDNNSSDEEFEALVRAAEPFPGIIFRWNYPYTYGGSPQSEQQTHSICISKHSVQRLGLTDMDEYLVLESGTLNELITPSVVKIYWRWIGRGNVESTDPRDYTRSARDREGLWYHKVICDPLRVDIGLFHDAYRSGVISVYASNASLYHYRGLTSGRRLSRSCDMEHHENCRYCEVENTNLLLAWPRDK